MAYSDGTVYATYGGYTVTGVGTKFLTNVVPGDVIYMNCSKPETAFTIFRVTSDTQLVLGEVYNATTTTTPGVTYNILQDFTKNFGWGLIKKGNPGWPITLAKTLEKIDHDLYKMQYPKKIKYIKLKVRTSFTIPDLTHGLLCYVDDGATYDNPFQYQLTPSAVWRKLNTVVV